VIDDADRAELADLAMRALDCITDDYGEDAELICACLVFEVRTPNADDEDDPDGATFHGNWRSLERNSPHHLAGLLAATANYMVAQ
jgi:hypothetical protein